MSEIFHGPSYIGEKVTAISPVDNRCTVLDEGPGNEVPRVSKHSPWGIAMITNQSPITNALPVPRYPQDREQA
jgi:hypothetical protein